jgi:hypothetical protein
MPYELWIGESLKNDPLVLLCKGIYSKRNDPKSRTTTAQNRMWRKRNVKRLRQTWRSFQMICRCRKVISDKDAKTKQKVTKSRRRDEIQMERTGISSGGTVLDRSSEFWHLSDQKWSVGGLSYFLDHPKAGEHLINSSNHHWTYRIRLDERWTMGHSPYWTYFCYSKQISFGDSLLGIDVSMSLLHLASTCLSQIFKIHAFSRQFPVSCFSWLK